MNAVKLSFKVKFRKRMLQLHFNLIYYVILQEQYSIYKLYDFFSVSLLGQIIHIFYVNCRIVSVLNKPLLRTILKRTVSRASCAWAAPWQGSILPSGP